MERGTYRRSLKSPGSEELLDLIVFRPAAYVLVKGIARFPVTPNQISLMSMVLGLGAAVAFALGSRSGMWWGALLYALANLLDCTDGQLARLQQSGTLMGRVVDGAADYISGIAVFTGLGIGLSAGGAGSWWLVIVAAISTSIHAIVFDHYQSRFLSFARGEPEYIEREMNRFEAELGRTRLENASVIRVQLLRGYLAYLRVQKRFSSIVHRPVAGAAGRGANDAHMIRLWSFLGPTTNRSLLIVCALFARVEVYLWLVAVAGNVWLIFVSILAASTNPPAGDGDRR